MRERKGKVNSAFDGLFQVTSLGFILVCVCVRVHTSVYKHICPGVHEHVGIRCGGQLLLLGVFLKSLFPFISRQGLSLNLGPPIA